ncbi:MAG: type II toxin-antitoxin system Phd/YefM family antitoxin [Firmicutes bacterium]|nr:type II toxin-antitoxin system Phd/YefM family antitoxin [Bacillota bacterium]
MIVNATDLKNNLGKYLRLCAREDIIITSNGRKIAKLTAWEKYEIPIVTREENLREPVEQYKIAPRKISYEEFLAISENSEERYEYIDGVLYLLAAPKAYHQKVISELHYLFYNWFQGKRCQPFFAPFDITLKRSGEQINVVQPDLMVICDLEENLNTKGYYMGVPALVVEVISENTRGIDFVKKLDLYMSTGVNEYWIINPFNLEVSIFLFEAQNISKNNTYKNRETAISFIFPGLEVSLERIFA